MWEPNWKHMAIVFGIIALLLVWVAMANGPYIHDHGTNNQHHPHPEYIERGE